MKRQRGRNRGGGGGGGKPQQNANRAFDSNGPDGVKVRGNAQTVFEKYQQLARDASSAGDRVLGENYLQHAEHYFRLLRAMQPQRPASEILGRDQYASGYDIDFEDEGLQAQAEAADEAAGDGPEAPADGEPGRWQGRDDRPRESRDRDGRDRYESRDRDRDGGRRDRWRERDDRTPDRSRDDRNPDRSRDDRNPDRSRDDRNPDRGRDDRPRAAGGEQRGEDRRDRFERNRDERPERDPLAVVEPQAASQLANGDDRPSPVLRDREGGESHAPAFLQAPAAPRAEADEEAPAKRPRRRRTPRSFEAGDGAPPASSSEPEEV